MNMDSQFNELRRDKELCDAVIDCMKGFLCDRFESFLRVSAFCDKDFSSIVN